MEFKRRLAVGAQALVWVVALAVVSMAGCGGGGGSAGVTGGAAARLSGTFVDLPVSGVSYTTSSGASGVTDSQGQFTYAAGDTVTFMIGNLVLGTAKPQGTTGGTATITPVNLVPGATDASNPQVQALGQLLATLNNLAGNSTYGIFAIPPNAAQLLASNNIASIADINDGTMQTMAGASAVSAASSVANVNQGLNAAPIVGTVWSAYCATCGTSSVPVSGTVYFEPNGVILGVTGDGSNFMSGSWTASSQVNGGVTYYIGDGPFSLAIGGTISQTTISSTTGPSSTLYTGISPMFALTEITSASSVSTAYAGGWFLSYTPNASGVAAQDTSGTGYVILAPDGSISGITNGSQYISGTWNIVTGKGTATFTDSHSVLATLALDASAQTGTVTKNGSVYGAIALSRKGSLYLNGDPYMGISDSGPVWNLPINIGGTGGVIGGGTGGSGGSCATTGGTGSGSVTITSGNYGSGNNGSITTCTTGSGTGAVSGVPVISFSSGHIASANSSNIFLNGFPNTIGVSENSTAPTLTFPLNVQINWTPGGTNAVSNFNLTLNLLDPSQNTLGTVVYREQDTSSATSTTDSLSVMYVPRQAASYSLSVDSSNCVIASGGTGTVNDAYSGNASAYPTVVINCN